MRKEFLKKGLAYIPETLLLLGGILCILADLIYASTSLITLLIIVGVLGILALLKWKSKNLALVISVNLGSVSLFFMLALLSEFAEFPSGSREGLQMLLTGSLLFLGLLTISIFLPVKYLRMGKTGSTNIDNQFPSPSQ